MAMEMITPELGGSGNGSQQTVPSNAGSLFDAMAGVLHHTVGSYFKGVGDDITDSIYANSQNNIQSGVLGNLGDEKFRNDYFDMIEQHKDELSKLQTLQDIQDESGTSAKSSDTKNLSGLLASSAYANSHALQSMFDMYQKTGDISWLEKMIDSYAAIENTQSARDYEKMMSDTAFSRLIDDIERKGYNPWLALQSGFGQASSGTSSAASVSGVSPSQQATSRANNVNTVSASKFGVITNALTSVLRIIVLAALMA